MNAEVCHMAGQKYTWPTKAKLQARPTNKLMDPALLKCSSNPRRSPAIVSLRCFIDCPSPFRYHP